MSPELQERYRSSKSGHGNLPSIRTCLKERLNSLSWRWLISPPTLFLVFGAFDRLQVSRYFPFIDLLVQTGIDASTP